MALRLVLAFIAGAVAASALLDASRHRQRGRHAAALFVEAVTLGGIGLWLAGHPSARDVTVMGGLCLPWACRTRSSPGCPARWCAPRI